MKGNILDVNESTRSGIISGEDGNRYNFETTEWKASVLPKTGTKVDFSVSGNSALAIYVDSAASSGIPSSNKLVAALLAFFLGSFGAHKFYLGYKKQGLIMLLVFIFGWILLGLPSLIIALIAFIEFIIYIMKTDEEFEQRYVINKKPWF